jgi:hypothetical protein
LRKPTLADPYALYEKTTVTFALTCWVPRFTGTITFWAALRSDAAGP